MTYFWMNIVILHSKIEYKLENFICKGGSITSSLISKGVGGYNLIFDSIPTGRKWVV